MASPPGTWQQKGAGQDWGFLGLGGIRFLLLWERTDLIEQLELGVTKLDVVIKQLHSVGG